MSTPRIAPSHRALLAFVSFEAASGLAVKAETSSRQQRCWGLKQVARARETDEAPEARGYRNPPWPVEPRGPEPEKVQEDICLETPQGGARRGEDGSCSCGCGDCGGCGGCAADGCCVDARVP